MRTLYDDEHYQFSDAVRTFIARSLPPRNSPPAHGSSFGRQAWLAAGELGLLGLGVPRDWGGSDAGDYRFQAIAIEQLARYSAGAASAFSIHFDVCAPYLVELTTTAQRERWLPKFCTGEIITAIAMTEPTGGSDLAALRTTAVEDGDEWVLDGSKTFITNGASADLVIVAARTTPDSRSKGISLFVVERGTPGFTSGSPLDKVGQHDVDTAELFLDEVRIPRDHLIGERDAGFLHMMSMLTQERVGSAVANLAHAHAAFCDTLEYVSDRTAFGSSIGKFQHNAFRLAELVTQLDVTQAFVDQCVLQHSRGELDATTAAKAKLWTSELQGVVLDACVQLHGGYGFMRETWVARAWVDARVTRIWAGSNEIMRLVISRDLDLG